MIRASMSLVAAILSALASVTVDAQDETVVRVDYVAVVVQADGTESPHAEGVHYIASDGRYRRDETPAGGTPTSEYRLPGDGVHVSVNQSLLEAVRSGRIPPVNVASPVGRGVALLPRAPRRRRSARGRWVRFDCRVARRFERGSGVRSTGCTNRR